MSPKKCLQNEGVAIFWRHFFGDIWFVVPCIKIGNGWIFDVWMSPTKNWLMRGIILLGYRND